MLLVPLLAAVTLSLSDSTEASVRSVPERSETSLDVGTVPAVGLSITSRRSSLDLGYQASLGWVDVTDDRDFVVFHSAGVGYGWGTRRLRLNLSVGGSYGRVSYLGAVAAANPVATQPAGGNPGPGGTPAPDQPAPSQPVQMPGQTPGNQTPQLLPEVSVLEIASAGVGLSASYSVSARWSALLGIGFSAGGGLDDSEAYLPFRYGPNANAGASYRATRVDTLTTSLSGSLDILPEAKGRYYTVTLLETWGHDFGPLTSGSLGAGATYVQAKPDPDSDKQRSVNGAGQAAISHAVQLDGGALAGISASALLNTAYNPVLGDVTQSVNGNVSAGWAADRTSLGVSVFASRSLPFDDPGAYTTYGASTGVTYRLTPLVSLRAGAYWTRQALAETPGVEPIDPNRWGANLGVTVAAPPIKL